MTDRCEGTYFDGASGQARAVELRRVGTSHYAVHGDGIVRSGALGEIAVTPPLARIARTVEFADGARLLIAHDVDIDAWFPERRGLEAFVDRLERHAHVVAAAIVFCVATMIAGAIWGVPWLADRIADNIPPAAEEELGKQVLSSLDRLGLHASEIEQERRDELKAHSTLSQNVPPEHPAIASNSATRRKSGPTHLPSRAARSSSPTNWSNFFTTIDSSTRSSRTRSAISSIGTRCARPCAARSSRSWPRCSPVT